MSMIEAGARCDKCGRIDTIAYTSDTAVKVMLRQKGWKFKANMCLCPICIVKDPSQAKDYQ